MKGVYRITSVIFHGVRLVMDIITINTQLCAHTVGMLQKKIKIQPIDKNSTVKKSVKNDTQIQRR